MWDVIRRILVLTASLCVFTGCLDQGEIKEDGTEVVWPGVDRDPDTYACNPITDPDNPDSHLAEDQGVLASLFYLPPELPNYSNVDDYILNGTQLEYELFFNQINVPTRPFDRGFETVDGQLIQTPEGDTLYEWMALQFEGKLHLNSGQSPGDYQMAVLSDDGAILEMDLDNDGTYETIVDNDGWHPTRLGCAPAVVAFDSDTEYNYRLKYFQGPKYHISVMLMMRPAPSDPADLLDPECGRQGNARYFDSIQTPPAPQAAYLNLLSRDWEVLAPENYSLESNEENPCNAPAPISSAVQISNVTKNSVSVSWITDIPAISVVEVTEVVTGDMTSGAVSSEFQISHSRTLSGLKSNTLYDLRVISTSTSGLSSTSVPDLSFRTGR